MEVEMQAMAVNREFKLEERTSVVVKCF